MPIQTILEHVKAWLPLAIFAISVAIACFACSSNSISRRQLRFDLFQERYRIFTAFRELFNSILKARDYPGHKIDRDFSTEISGYCFLFGKEIESYSKEVQDKLNRLMNLRKRLPGNKDEDREIAKQKTDLEHWFANQFIIAEELFSEYLSFRKIK